MPPKKPLPPSQADEVDDAAQPAPVTGASADTENPTPDAEPRKPDSDPEPEPEPSEEDDVAHPEAEAEGPFPCPICGGAGHLDFRPPFDPTSRECPDCGGIGMVLTGSKVPENSARPCNRCEGKGFIEAPGTVAGVPIGAGAELPATDKQYYDATDPATWHLPTRPSGWEAS